MDSKLTRKRLRSQSRPSLEKSSPVTRKKVTLDDRSRKQEKNKQPDGSESIPERGRKRTLAHGRKSASMDMPEEMHHASPDTLKRRSGRGKKNSDLPETKAKLAEKRAEVKPVKEKAATEAPKKGAKKNTVADSGTNTGEVTSKANDSPSTSKGKEPQAKGKMYSLLKDTIKMRKVLAKEKVKRPAKKLEPKKMPATGLPDTKRQLKKVKVVTAMKKTKLEKTMKVSAVGKDEGSSNLGQNTGTGDKVLPTSLGGKAMVKGKKTNSAGNKTKAAKGKTITKKIDKNNKGKRVAVKVMGSKGVRKFQKHGTDKNIKSNRKQKAQASMKRGKMPSERKKPTKNVNSNRKQGKATDVAKMNIKKESQDTSQEVSDILPSAPGQNVLKETNMSDDDSNNEHDISFVEETVDEGLADGLHLCDDDVSSAICNETHDCDDVKEEGILSEEVINDTEDLMEVGNSNNSEPCKEPINTENDSGRGPSENVDAGSTDIQNEMDTNPDQPVEERAVSDEVSQKEPDILSHNADEGSSKENESTVNDTHSDASVLQPESTPMDMTFENKPCEEPEKESTGESECHLNADNAEDVSSVQEDTHGEKLSSEPEVSTETLHMPTEMPTSVGLVEHSSPEVPENLDDNTQKESDSTVVLEQSSEISVNSEIQSLEKPAPSNAEVSHDLSLGSTPNDNLDKEKPNENKTTESYISSKDDIDSHLSQKSEDTTLSVDNEPDIDNSGVVSDESKDIKPEEEYATVKTESSVQGPTNTSHRSAKFRKRGELELLYDVSGPPSKRSRSAKSVFLQQVEHGRRASSPNVDDTVKTRGKRVRSISVGRKETKEIPKTNAKENSPVPVLPAEQSVVMDDVAGDNSSTISTVNDITVDQQITENSTKEEVRKDTLSTISTKTDVTVEQQVMENKEHHEEDKAAQEEHTLDSVNKQQREQPVKDSNLSPQQETQNDLKNTQDEDASPPLERDSKSEESMIIADSFPVAEERETSPEEPSLDRFPDRPKSVPDLLLQSDAETKDGSDMEISKTIDNEDPSSSSTIVSECAPCHVVLIDVVKCLELSAVESEQSTPNQTHTFHDIENIEKLAQPEKQRPSDLKSNSESTPSYEQPTKEKTDGEEEVRRVPPLKIKLSSIYGADGKGKNSPTIISQPGYTYGRKDSKKLPFKPSIQEHFRCKQCPFLSDVKNVVVEHTACHSNMKHYSCGYCTTNFLLKESALLHSKRHHFGQPYQVSNSRVINKEAELIIHMKMKQRQKVASRGGDSSDETKNVLLPNVHKKVERRYVCPHCDLALCKYADGMVKHFQKWHPNQKVILQYQSVTSDVVMPAKEEVRKRSSAKPKSMKMTARKSTGGRHLKKQTPVILNVPDVSVRDSHNKKGSKPVKDISDTNSSAKKRKHDVEHDVEEPLVLKIADVRSLANNDTENLPSVEARPVKSSVQCNFCKLVLDTVTEAIEHIEAKHSMDYWYACPYCPFGCSKNKDNMLRHIQRTHPDEKSDVEISLVEEERYFKRVTQNTEPAKDPSGIKATKENNVDGAAMNISLPKQAKESASKNEEPLLHHLSPKSSVIVQMSEPVVIESSELEKQQHPPGPISVASKNVSPYRTDYRTEKESSDVGVSMKARIEGQSGAKEKRPSHQTVMPTCGFEDDYNIELIRAYSVFNLNPKKVSAKNVF